MGNLLGGGQKEDPDSAWQEQNKEMEQNPIYKFADLNKGGKLVEAYRKGGVIAVQEIAKKEIQPYLYNEGKGKKISKLDYIKWKRKKEAKKTGSSVWESQSDQELLAEFEEQEEKGFNKVHPHEACWDLDKRGGVGETPVHMLFLMDSAEHAETGKILLNMYPKLALDFYEADEYFGENALHLATVYGDFESVKLLVSNGAYINQRATGRFFLPEDQKNGKTSMTNYEGFAYYGEYPLAFAACFGYMDIYDYLIDNGADPNLQDSFGNTALHMAVIADQAEMYKYMVKHHKKPAKNSIQNNANLTPLTLASKLGRHKLFKEILEINCVDFWRYSNVTCSVYPLTEIDSINIHGEPNWNSALMIAINGEEDDHLEMLEGGVMRQLLDDKWKTFARRRFFERLILTFLHLSLISVAVYLRPAKGLLDYNEPKDAVRFTAEILICFFCVGYLAMEVVEIGSQGVIAFLKNCSHAPAHTVFMLSCLLILLCIPFRLLQLQTIEDVLMIIAVPGSWFFLLFFARIVGDTLNYGTPLANRVDPDETAPTGAVSSGSTLFANTSNHVTMRSVPLTGPFVTMIYKMCVGDLLRFGIIYLIFLIGFTQGFYFLFRDINQESFNTLPNTIMTLFQMTLGEFKYHDFDLTRYALLTKLVFAVFMILVPILLLNMLIAMMGNTYQSVIAKSEKEWRKQWAKIVVVLERGFTKKQLQRYYREYSIKLSGPPEEAGNKTGEIRALVVIKTSVKTKARQRKIAVGNWKKLGREIITQLKEQKKKGKTGPLRLTKVQRKSTTTGNKKPGESESDDDAKFTNITAQLAWEKDIDLTKGQVFMTNTEPLDKQPVKSPPVKSPPVADGKSSGTATPDRKSMTEEHALLPNGNGPRVIRKYVKKPNGTPKSSPKVNKQFPSHNRVSPHPASELQSVLNDSELEIPVSTLTVRDINVTEKSERPDRGTKSEADLLKSSEKQSEKERSEKRNSMSHFIVRADEGYVSHMSRNTSGATKSSEEAQSETPRPGSSESKYDQWADEIIESSPGASPSKSTDSSPTRKHKDRKRRREKREKREKKREKEQSKEENEETKKVQQASGTKSPTSDEVLLLGSNDDNVQEETTM